MSNLRTIANSRLVDGEKLDNLPNNSLGTFLQDAPVDGKQYARKNGTWDEVVLTGNINWTDIINKPLTFTPSAHTHTKSDITDFPTIPTKTSDLTNDSGFLTSSPVTSVAGKTGAVTLVPGDVGLGNVDNTSDLNKPISSLTQTALNNKITGTQTVVTTLGTDHTTIPTSKAVADAMVSAGKIENYTPVPEVAITPNLIEQIYPLGEDVNINDALFIDNNDIPADSVLNIGDIVDNKKVGISVLGNNTLGNTLTITAGYYGNPSTNLELNIEGDSTDSPNGSNISSNAIATILKGNLPGPEMNGKGTAQASHAGGTWEGARFTATSGFYINYIFAVAGTNPNQARLIINGVISQTYSVVSGVANIGSVFIKSGDSVRVEVTNGSSWTGAYTSGTFPNGTNLNWNTGSQNGVDSSSICAVAGVGISKEITVTLNGNVQLNGQGWVILKQQSETVNSSNYYYINLQSKTNHLKGVYKFNTSWTLLPNKYCFIKSSLFVKEKLVKLSQSNFNLITKGQIFFALNSNTRGNIIPIIARGLVGGFVGLTESYYYASAVPGLITTVKGGSNIVVGKGKDKYLQMRDALFNYSSEYTSNLTITNVANSTNINVIFDCIGTFILSSNNASYTAKLQYSINGKDWIDLYSTTNSSITKTIYLSSGLYRLSSISANGYNGTLSFTYYY